MSTIDITATGPIVQVRRDAIGSAIVEHNGWKIVAYNRTATLIAPQWPGRRAELIKWSHDEKGFVELFIEMPEGKEPMYYAYHRADFGAPGHVIAGAADPALVIVAAHKLMGME